MIVSLRIRNAKADGHLVQEQGIWKVAVVFPQIITGVEYQFKTTGRELVIRQQGLVTTPIGVGASGCQQLPKYPANKRRLQ